MGFWGNFGKGILSVVKIGAKAVADTAAAGKAITLGNIGIGAARGVGNMKLSDHSGDLHAMEHSITLEQALDIIAAWQAKSAKRQHWFEAVTGGIFSRLSVDGEIVEDFWPTEHYPDGRIRSAQKIKREGEPGGRWSELNFSVGDKPDPPDRST